MLYKHWNKIKHSIHASYSANTIYLYIYMYVGSMLGQRRRRWYNIEPTNNKIIILCLLE